MAPIAQEQLVRLNVNMNRETAKALKELAKKDKVSLTEAIRRAIAVYKYVSDEVKKGRVVQTMDADGKNRREIVLM